MSRWVHKKSGKEIEADLSDWVEIRDDRLDKIRLMDIYTFLKKYERVD